MIGICEEQKGGSKKEIYKTELLNTLKSIDGTLKRIEQAVAPKKHSEKDYECPF